MRASKEAMALAKDLGLDDSDAAEMELKAKLYRKAAKGIQKSKLTRGEIAKKVGISEAKINRTSRLGVNHLSIELLIKIIFTLENKMPPEVTEY